MTKALRHRCRNPHCRSKLAVPVENERHAFCVRHCYETFYRNRCRVCERDLRKTGKRGDAGRLYCRPPANCRREAEKWPEKYAAGPWASFSETKLGSAHSTGIKSGTEGDRPSAHGLRHWSWHRIAVCDVSGPGEIEAHALENAEGNRVAIVRASVGQPGSYYMSFPRSIPLPPLEPLKQAKRRAESFAPMAMTLDPKLAARITRENWTPHPMGPPLNRHWPTPTAETSRIAFKQSAPWSDDLDIPDCLQRQQPAADLKEAA